MVTNNVAQHIANISIRQYSAAKRHYAQLLHDLHSEIPARPGVVVCKNICLNANYPLQYFIGLVMRTHCFIKAFAVENINNAVISAKSGDYHAGV